MPSNFWKHHSVCLCLLAHKAIWTSLVPCLENLYSIYLYCLQLVLTNTLAIIREGNEIGFLTSSMLKSILSKYKSETIWVYFNGQSHFCQRLAWFWNWRLTCRSMVLVSVLTEASIMEAKSALYICKTQQFFHGKRDSWGGYIFKDSLRSSGFSRATKSFDFSETIFFSSSLCFWQVICTANLALFVEPGRRKSLKAFTMVSFVILLRISTSSSLDWKSYLHSSINMKFQMQQIISRPDTNSFMDFFGHYDLVTCSQYNHFESLLSH